MTKCNFWENHWSRKRLYISYISKALYYKGSKNFPKKIFFCSTNFIYIELPNAHPHHIANFDKFNIYFIDNPDIIVEKYDLDQNKNIEEVIGDTFKPKLKKKNMTETDKLSFLVRTIDHDKSVVPLGEYKMIPANEKRRNYLFEGISSENLDKKEKYEHFRQFESNEKKDKIAIGKAVFDFDFDFLDSIADNPIKDS